jgi:hypothetical protein
VIGLGSLHNKAKGRLSPSSGHMAQLLGLIAVAGGVEMAVQDGQ